MDTRAEQALCQSRAKTKRNFIWAAIGLILLTIAAILGISAYVGWNLTHPVREKITTSPAAVGLTYEDVSFKSREDGLNLSGWLIKAPENEVDTVSPVNEVKNFNGRPLFLIHGEGDTDIPIENSELL